MDDRWTVGDYLLEPVTESENKNKISRHSDVNINGIRDTAVSHDRIATFSKSRLRDNGDGNNRESLGNRSRRPRQYSSTLAVICATATAATEALRKSFFFFFCENCLYLRNQ